MPLLDCRPFGAKVEHAKSLRAQEIDRFALNEASLCMHWHWAKASLMSGQGSVCSCQSQVKGEVEHLEGKHLPVSSSCDNP